jgi:thioredoxin 2
MEILKIVCPECSSVNTVQSEVENTTIACSHCQAELDDPFPLDVNDERCTIHITENDIPVLVDFYSPLCGPCMAMYEDYEDAALSFGLKVRFLKINADEHQKVAREYGVGALPTIIAFKHGQEVNRVSAQLSRVELTLWAERLIEV